MVARFAILANAIPWRTKIPWKRSAIVVVVAVVVVMATLLAASRHVW